VRTGWIADRYQAFWAWVVSWLPFGLSRWVAPSFLGFAAINGFTFGVDLSVVTLVHGVAGLPVPVAVTCGYGVAFALSFALNRFLTFRSRDRLGAETVKYVAAVAFNFFVLLLGITTLLADHLGVQYQVARVLAGCCEGLFMYTAMRFWIFRRTPETVDA
jgi:putative flippase GtrA